MSESILRALIRLFALISDIHADREISSRGRDVVRLFLSKQLNNEQVLKYMAMFDEYLGIYYPDIISKDSIKDRKRTSLTAMRILAICEKINEELQQKQKIYVLGQLMDFISFSAEITGKEMEFLETVATAFNIHPAEYSDILGFILEPDQISIRQGKLLIIDNKTSHGRQGIKHLFNENLRGRITFLNVASTNTLLMKYEGREDLLLNGQNIFPGQTYVFDHGSSIRGASANAIYYNEVAEVFTGAAFKVRVSLDARDISLRFRDSENGIQNLTFHEDSGKLVGDNGRQRCGEIDTAECPERHYRPDTGKYAY